METERIRKFTNLVYRYTEARNLSDPEKMEKEIQTVKENIKEALCLPELAPHLLVFISSLTPGTGASTVRSLLAEVLGYESPSDPPIQSAERDAGKYRRMLAALWEHRSKGKTKSQKLWNQFQAELERSPNTLQELSTYYGREEYSFYFDEDTLRRFNDDMENYTNEETSPFWTKIPDSEIWKRIYTQGKGVFTGKLTARIDTITDNEDVLKERETSVARFELKVEDFEGGRRVDERDMKKGKIESLKRGSLRLLKRIQDSVNLNKKRMKQDRKEYETLYDIDMDTFFDPMHGIIEIDTTDKTPEQVVGYMLFIISQMLVKQPCEDSIDDDQLPEAS